MKILFVGDACVSTGFARCTHAACDALHAAGHDVRVLGMNYHGDPHGYPYPIHPCFQPSDGGRDYMGAGRMPLLAHRYDVDCVVMLNDPWNIPAYLDAFRGYTDRMLEHGVTVKRPRMIGWLAVDGANQKGERLNELDHVVTWVDWAGHELKRGGYNGRWTVAPLGVDQSLFVPRPREEARKRALPPEWADKFVVGVVGRNQMRKRLDLTMKYFSHWIDSMDITDARLFLHSAPTGEEGSDIRSLAHYYGLGNRVLLCEPPVGIGVDEKMLSYVYSSFDVYATMSQGEGWGLPTLEAMSCGVPCIVPDWSGLGGWVMDAAVKIPCPTTALTAPMNGMMHTIGGVPDERTFIEELDAMYRSEVHRRTYISRGLLRARELTWSSTGSIMQSVVERVCAPAVAPAVASEVA